VLTRDESLDRSHPLFATAEVCVRQSGLREVLAWLRAERGIDSVAVEAGWSTSRSAYDTPPVIDELLLSICESSELPARSRGVEVLSNEALARSFAQRSEYQSNEESGNWSFLRFHS